MNNFLLYLKYNSNAFEYDKYENIYCFNNKKVVAIDELEYDKNTRLNLQKILEIRPYFLSQKVFMETLFYALKTENTNILLSDVIFLDEYIEDSLEYEELIEMLKGNNKNKAYNQISKILSENDTEIYQIKLKFNGNNIILTKEGVLEIDNSSISITNLINDVKFNNLILGLG